MECDRLDNKAQARALKLASMHITNWEEAQHEDVLLATSCKWLSMKKSITPQKRDTLLKECMGEHSTSEEGKALFHVRNNLNMRKGLMYMNIMPKGEMEGLLASWCHPHIGAWLWMVCTEMPDTRVNRGH